MKTKLINGNCQLFIEKRVIYQNPPEGFFEKKLKSVEKASDKQEKEQQKEPLKQIEEAVKALEEGKGEKEKLMLDVINLLSGQETYKLFSPELLTALASRKEVDVRIFVSRNPNTPGKIRLQLLNDPRVRREYFNWDTSTYQSWLKPLVYDPDPTVRENARRVIESVNAAEWMNHGKGKINLSMLLIPAEKAALDSNTPPAKLAQIAKHPDFSVKIAIATNPSTPLNTLQSLAKDKNSNVANAAKSELERRNEKK